LAAVSPDEVLLEVSPMTYSQKAAENKAVENKGVEQHSATAQ
jgi:hypothetical protein